MVSAPISISRAAASSCARLSCRNWGSSQIKCSHAKNCALRCSSGFINFLASLDRGCCVSITAETGNCWLTYLATYRLDGRPAILLAGLWIITKWKRITANTADDIMHFMTLEQTAMRRLLMFPASAPRLLSTTIASIVDCQPIDCYLMLSTNARLLLAQLFRFRGLGCDQQNRGIRPWMRTRTPSKSGRLRRKRRCFG